MNLLVLWRVFDTNTDPICLIVRQENKNESIGRIFANLIISTLFNRKSHSKSKSLLEAQSDFNLNKVTTKDVLSVKAQSDFDKASLKTI